MLMERYVYMTYLIRLVRYEGREKEGNPYIPNQVTQVWAANLSILMRLVGYGFVDG